MQTVWNFDAIGTKWQIDIEWAGRAEYEADLKAATFERIDRFDRTYSRFRKDSEVTKWATPGSYEMPDDGYRLFSFYKKMYGLTGGKVTPLIGTLMSDIGYDLNYSFVQKSPAPAPSWQNGFDFDQTTLTTKQPVMIDVGAAGKGYLIDEIVELLCTEPSVRTIVVNAGGDIRRWSRDVTRPIRIGLENPHDHTQALGVIELSTGSLCASSGSRRKWGALHHIIDPEKLTSPTEVVATWVRADEALVADGLATALFFVQPEKLKVYDFAYAILHRDGTLQYTPNLLVEVFQHEIY